MSKPYQPGSGTEGCIFMDRFCDRCVHDAAYQDNPESGEGCSLIVNAMAYDIGDEKYPKEWIEDDDGDNPRCTKFELSTPELRQLKNAKETMAALEANGQQRLINE